MSGTINEIVDQYVDLLILQYRDKPRARATIAILLKQAVADALADSLATCFNLSSAVGPQLDIVGKYIGVPRDVGPAGSIPYFGFQNYAGTGSTVGFRNYAGLTNLTGVWETYSDGEGPDTNLNDVEYRLVLQLKVILNANDGTNASIMAYLFQFFPGLVTMVDNQDMTVTYTVSPDVPIDTTTLAAYLPKPMGVGITVNVASPSGTRVTSGGATRITSGSATRVTNA